MSELRESPRLLGKRKRGSSPKTPAPSSSVAPTKPQAPQIVDGYVEFPLESVKEHFTCLLCDGYLRCAHTISECLHSFCKSCLFVAYSRGVTKCPACHINLGPDPSSVTIYDRTLQELVDKVLPELNEIDHVEEIKYYKKKNIPPKEEYAQEIDREEIRVLGGGESSCCREGRSKRKELKAQNESTGGDSSPSQRSKLRRRVSESSQDELNVELQMEQSTWERVRESISKGGVTATNKKDLLIRTSGRLKIGQLKKYIQSQWNLESPSYSKVVIKCHGDIVEDSSSLAFVQRTRWLTLEKVMILTFSFS